MKIWRKIKSWPKWLKWSFGSLIVILIVVRIALPYIAKHQINKALAEMEGYNGSVEDVDISIIRGAFAIDDILFYEKNIGENEPLLKMQRVEASIQWKALFDGFIVAEIVMENPIVNFSYVKTEEGVKDNFEEAEPMVWQEQVMNLIPFELNFIRINNGEFHYKDKTVNPTIDVYATNMDLEVKNISNTKDVEKKKASTFKFTAKAFGNAPIELKGNFNPFDTKITVDSKFKLESLNVPELNDFLKVYAAIDAEGGKFNLYSELKIEKGEIDGYVKPLIQNLEILSFKADKNKPLNMIWQGIAEGLSELIENISDQQIGTKVPLKGNINNPDIGLWTTFRVLFKNAIIESLRPTLDGKVDLKKEKKDKQKNKDDEGLFNGLFNGKNK